MKTVILTVTFFLTTLLSTSIFAQEKNEFKLSYGYSGVDFDRNLSWGWDDYIDQTYGTLNLSYNRRIHKKVSVGAQVNYTFVNSRKAEIAYDNYGHPQYDDYGNIIYGDNTKSKHEHIVKPSVKLGLFYISKPDFELYSEAMLSPIPNLVPHFTLLGFRYGSKHAVFGEIGVGYGQLVSAGYSFKL